MQIKDRFEMAVCLGGSALIAAGCIGVWPINHKCSIDEFSDFTVAENSISGERRLTISGWRSVDSVTGVKGIKKDFKCGNWSIVAYSGPFWLRDNKALCLNVSLNEAKTVVFADTLLWTRKNGIENGFRKTLRPTPKETLSLDELLNVLSPTQ